MSDREPQERRRHTLADKFITRKFSDWERAVHPKAIAQLQRSARDARRFILTDEATLRIAEIVDTIPDLLVREQQFARAPYDVTWIEYPSHILWQYMRDQHPDAYKGLGKFGDVDSADHTIGYLIDHERVNIICGGTIERPDQVPNIMPVQYRLHTEWTLAEQIEFRRLTGLHDENNTDAFMWGSTYTNIAPEQRRALAFRHAIDFLPFNPAHHNYGKFNTDAAWSDAVRGSVGELRNIIAIMLVMNRPSLTKYVHTSTPGRGFFKGKLLPYLSHTTVTIDLDARPTLRLIGTPAGDAIERRRHEVKGHYKHDETARDYARIAGCIHEFQPTQGPEDDWAPWQGLPLGMPGEPGAPRNWVCASCGGKRWWHKDHGRGSAAKGFVAKDGYDVGTGP